MRQKRKLIVAIDGPVGSGKTTVCREVARRLGYLYLSTGALYRAIAFKVVVQKIDQNNEMALEKLIKETKIKVISAEKGNRTILDDQDVTEKLSDPNISMIASSISALPGVRKGLLDLQRSLGKNGGIVMEGRDIGTVVFPDADIKIYLSASVEERARRRFDELKGYGKEVSLEATIEDLIRRDNQDSTRSVAPLKVAEGAIQVDSTNLNFQQVVDKIVEIVQTSQGSAEKK
jgi:cytidylate kinase